MEWVSASPGYSIFSRWCCMEEIFSRAPFTIQICSWTRWPLRCFYATPGVLWFYFYYASAGYVSHCLNQTLDRSTVWNIDGSHIYFVFQFLEAVSLSLRQFGPWPSWHLDLSHTVFVYCKEHGKLTSWQCSAVKSKVKPLTGEQTQSFPRKIAIWPVNVSGHNPR